MDPGNPKEPRPEKSKAIDYAVRSFYEQSAEAASTTQHPAWPTFDELSPDQMLTWMIALATTIEASVRVAEAFTSVGLDGA